MREEHSIRIEAEQIHWEKGKMKCGECVSSSRYTAFLGVKCNYRRVGPPGQDVSKLFYK